MNQGKYMVYIIDDDPSVCRSLCLLLDAYGFQTETFHTVMEFLASHPVPEPGCILLDVYLKGLSAIDLYHSIAQDVPFLPIIYITGHGDVPMSVSALKKGAVNFLQKPLDDQELLRAVEEAVAISKEFLETENGMLGARHALGKLTPRELEIFRMITNGYLNKQIAGELGISEQTVKIHRGRITSKLKIQSVAGLVRLELQARKKPT